MGLMASAFDFLRVSQDATGGWGYLPGHYPTVEATAAVIIALRDEPRASKMVEWGFRWLRTTQHTDGGWGYAADDEESGWGTAWAVLAFAKRQIYDETYRRGVEWLINTKSLGNRDDDFSKLDELVDASDSIVHSWPWYPGEAGWVEPTSLSILALEKEKDNQAIATRLKQSFTYLQQRRCPNGGWNVGNPMMYEKALPGRASQTAVVILALLTSGLELYEQQDIVTMRNDMFADGSPLALGWGRLVHRVLGLDDGGANAVIASLQQENGSWSNNSLHTAVVLMAERGNL
jgi:hypothetical protein